MNLIAWVFAAIGAWRMGQWSVDLMDVWRKRSYRFRYPTCGLRVIGRVRADHEASHQKKVV